MGDKPIRKPLLLLVLCIFIELCTSSQNMWNAGVDSRDDLFLSCWRPSLRLGLKWTLVLNQTKTHFYCSEFRLDLQWRTGSDFWCGSNLGTRPFKKWFQKEVFILKKFQGRQNKDWRWCHKVSWTLVCGRRWWLDKQNTIYGSLGLNFARLLLSSVPIRSSDWKSGPIT